MRDFSEADTWSRACQGRASWKLSRYVVATDPVFDEDDCLTKRVVFATRTAAVRAIDEFTWQNLAAHRFEQLPAAFFRDYREIGVIVPEEEHELQFLLEENDIAAAGSDDLYVVVQPTAMCQLGCGYCGQHHTPRQMGEDDRTLLLERVRTDLAGGRTFKSLSVCWFGGEPLLGLTVIRALTPELQAIAERAGCAYGAKIVTNGLALSPRLAEELIARHSVREFELTIDGYKDAHDARRHKKSGNPTFAKIFDNLISLASRRDQEIKINVRCNVDRGNYLSVMPLIHALAEKGVQRRINFYTVSVYSWGNAADKLALPREEYAEWEIRWLVEQLKLGFTPSLIPERKPVVCMSVDPHSRLYDAYGGIYNCTEVSYVPSYGAPNRFEIGTLRTGEKNSEKLAILSDFNKQISTASYDCKDCVMLPVCGGSCPKKWLEGFVPCPSAKTNIKERLLLAYAYHKRNNI